MADDRWKKYRREANVLHGKRQEWTFKHERSKERGDAERAEKCKQQVEHFTNLRIKANMEAAVNIFIDNNKKKKRPMNVIDLHGLFLEEVEYFLAPTIIIANGAYDLVVIVGKGNNSKQGPKIKPYVENYAQRWSIPVENEENMGRITLRLTKWSKEKRIMHKKRPPLKTFDPREELKIIEEGKQILKVENAKIAELNQWQIVGRNGKWKPKRE